MLPSSSSPHSLLQEAAEAVRPTVASSAPPVNNQRALENISKASRLVDVADRTLAAAEATLKENELRRAERAARKNQERGVSNNVKEEAKSGEKQREEAALREERQKALMVQRERAEKALRLKEIQQDHVKRLARLRQEEVDEEIRTELLALEERSAALQEQIAALEESLAEGEQQMSVLDNELAAINAKVSEEELAISRCIEDIADLEADRDELTLEAKQLLEDGIRVMEEINAAALALEIEAALLSEVPFAAAALIAAAAALRHQGQFYYQRMQAESQRCSSMAQHKSDAMNRTASEQQKHECTRKELLHKQEEAEGSIRHAEHGRSALLLQLEGLRKELATCETSATGMRKSLMGVSTRYNDVRSIFEARRSDADASASLSSSSMSHHRVRQQADERNIVANTHAVAYS